MRAACDVSVPNWQRPASQETMLCSHTWRGLTQINASGKSERSPTQVETDRWINRCTIGGFRDADVASELSKRAKLARILHIQIIKSAKREAIRKMASEPVHPKSNRPTTDNHATLSKQVFVICHVTVRTGDTPRRHMRSLRAGSESLLRRGKEVGIFIAPATLDNGRHRPWQCPHAQ